MNLESTWTKIRLTHDLSFSFLPASSMNDIAITEGLTACQYGFAIFWFLHIIVALRAKFSRVLLLLTKIDWKSAYRRIHLPMFLALQCIVVLTDLIKKAISLPFGASPFPSLFSDISETVTDLANALQGCPSWDPAVVHSQWCHLLGPPKVKPASIVFRPARRLIVDVPVDDHGKAETFMDDSFNLFPALSPLHILRGAWSLPLALDIISCPLGQGEGVVREVMISLTKLIAEKNEQTPDHPGLDDRYPPSAHFSPRRQIPSVD